MYLKRILLLVIGAVVCVAVGLALILTAMQPHSGDETPPAVEQSLPAEAAAPETAPVETPATSPVQNVVADTATLRLRVEKAIAAAPEYARFFARLHEAFPAEYDKTLDSFAERLRGAQSEESADYYASEAVRLLRQARGVAAAKAEAATLSRVFDVQLEMLRALAKEDKKLCVAFLYGATNQDFQRFAVGRRALVGDMAAAGLEAIVSGQTKKVERSAPSDADFQTLEKALTAKGLQKVEIDALLDGKMPDPPLPDDKMCAAGQTYLGVLHALPEAVRLRIYGLAVELMARS
jgi:hypothetical protein